MKIKVWESEYVPSYRPAYRACSAWKDRHFFANDTGDALEETQS